MDEQNIWREDLRDISDCYHHSVDNILLVSTLILGACYEMVSNGTFPDADVGEFYLGMYCCFLWGSVFGPFWSIFFCLVVKKKLLDFSLVATTNRTTVHFKNWDFPTFWRTHCRRLYKFGEFFLWLSIVSSLCFVVTLSCEEWIVSDHYPASTIFVTYAISLTNFTMMALVLLLLYCGYYDLKNYSDEDFVHSLTHKQSVAS